jgi:biopolymer transport protein ExbB
MKVRTAAVLWALAILAAAVRGAETIDDAMNRAALDYGQRLSQANDELNQARDRIAHEKAPLLAAIGAAENRIAAAELESTRLQAAESRSQEDFRKLNKDLAALKKTEAYVDSVSHDSLVALEGGLLPGERQLLSSRLLILDGELGDTAKSSVAQRSSGATDLLLDEVQHCLGGYSAAGSSIIGSTNQVSKGTFAFVGPESFFWPGEGGPAGTVRTREGTDLPITYLLPDWKPDAAEAFFKGQAGTVFADATLGKALRLEEAKGTLLQHINKGGMVSYAIICVGLLALFMIVQKMRDISRMAVDTPDAVRLCLEVVALGTPNEAEHSVRSLKATTRELFMVGLRYIGQPKELLEEHLDAVLLRQRLQYERWLPLLAVIATAAPLMGLLGTVTGMVRTFALITVFGTGNAGNLASGISEVLIATQLGLIVAIPTLVAHGFLSHRVHKNLSLLERYALEFVTVSQRDGSGAAVGEAVPL